MNGNNRTTSLRRVPIADNAIDSDLTSLLSGTAPAGSPRSWRVLQVLALCFAIFCLPLYGQSPSATVTGSVWDPSGASIPGADVTVTGVDTSVSSKTVTNDAGIYRISGLVPGTYRIEVSMQGFQSLTQDGIQIHVGDTATLNYTLKVGSISDMVTVEASAVILESASATVSHVIDGRQIDDTPLNGRNVMNLLGLAPGVVPQGATSGAVTNNQPAMGNYTNPAGWSNYQISGGVAGQNSLSLDGAPLNVPMQNWVGLIPTESSVGEFRVESSNIGADQGRYYGGVISFSTKSGTNDVHGSAYDYFRNGFLNANNTFNKASGIERPGMVQNQYGVSLGGPVIKNKLFLFGNWEGYANRSGLPYAARVPTAPERNGDFTNDAPIFTIFGTQVSCNGVLNKICVDPTANHMVNDLNYWPLPNLSNIPEGGINYRTNATTGSNNNQVNVRADYSTAKNQAFARYTYWRTHGIGSDYYHNGGPTIPTTLSASHQAILGDTYTLTPTTVADVRLSYTRFSFDSVPFSINNVDYSKFPGIAPFEGQMTYNLLPTPWLFGYGPTMLPIQIVNVIQFYRFNTYNLTGNVNKISGKHAFRFGGVAQRQQTYASPNVLSASGLFIFFGGYPTPNVFANFMMGQSAPNTGQISTGMGVDVMEPYGALYLMDTFSVTPKLTLNAGVRWDVPYGFTEKHDLNTMLLPDAASPLGSIQNPATGSLQTLKGKFALVNSADYPSRSDDSSHYKLFAPSAGLAYRLFKRTVVRTGYTLSFLPNDTGFPSAGMTPITALTTASPTGLLSNPFPQLNGVLPQAYGRKTGWDNSVLGNAVSGRVPNSPYPYVQQWNFNIQQELWQNSVLQIGYLGTKGTHLKMSGSLNTLATSLAAQAETQYKSLVASGLSSGAAEAQTFLMVNVANPLAGKLSSSSLYNGATITQGQLLRPYPQFSGVTSQSFDVGVSTYHSLQASYRMRFQSAGTVFLAYTWAKNMGTVDSTTGFLEYSSIGGIQNPNDLAMERSLASFDVNHRLVLNYSLTLPFGKGRHWLPNAGPVANRLVAGWTVSSITSFQSGFPLAFTSAASSDLSTSFGYGTIRPTVVAGCQAKISGSAQSRLSKWFNTACFTAPATPFSLGNEGRTDSVLRTHGISNWDVALAKDIAVNERFRLLFTTQFLNMFNRVQFGSINSQVGNALFGQATMQINNPRQIQFALKLTF